MGSVPCKKGIYPLEGVVRVKRWGKSPPAMQVTASAWQTPPGARPNREWVARPILPGRSLEVSGNWHPR